MVCSGWYILMMKSFQTVPTSMIESAKIDGQKSVYFYVFACVKAGICYNRLFYIPALNDLVASVY